MYLGGGASPDYLTLGSLGAKNFTSVFLQFTFTACLLDDCCYSHFTDEETKVQGEVSDQLRTTQTGTEREVSLTPKLLL